MNTPMNKDPWGFLDELLDTGSRTNYAISADLPEMADPKVLTARLENGLLTIVVKKRAESKPKQIETQ